MLSLTNFETLHLTFKSNENFLGHAAIYEKRTYLLALFRAVVSIEVFRYNFQWIIQCLSL